jgi:AcrR family transcriptional regulator
VIWAIKARSSPDREKFVSVAVHKATRSARKPKGEGYVRRTEILEAGERIFVEYGYEGATIRRIAEEVGVSSTALYMHFKDKSEILLEICERVFDRMLKDHQELGKGCAPPEERVRLLLQSYMRFGLDNPNAYRLVFCTRPREATEGADKVAQRLGKELFDVFAGHVAEIAAAGRLRGDPVATAQALWAGAHGVISLEITKPYFDWAPKLESTMLDVLFEGVLTR